MPIAREKWGKVTDDQIDVIDGKREQLIGRRQEIDGYNREKAEQEVKAWESGVRW
ncbi:MAG TPA: general stress protein CsbD [Candidatus Angelobacter sp.]|nr:general stress protein CsbD [Candidatus Angelobacter sp.]